MYPHVLTKAVCHTDTVGVPADTKNAEKDKDFVSVGYELKELPHYF